MFFINDFDMMGEIEGVRSGDTVRIEEGPKFPDTERNVWAFYSKATNAVVLVDMDGPEADGLNLHDYKNCIGAVTGIIRPIEEPATPTTEQPAFS